MDVEGKVERERLRNALEHLESRIGNLRPMPSPDNTMICICQTWRVRKDPASPYGMTLTGEPARNGRMFSPEVVVENPQRRSALGNSMVERRM